MANIGEALTTRLARERSQAIKKFISVRDSVREELQARQQSREGFAESTEELFKPVTAVTGKVLTSIIGRTPEEGGKPQRGLLQAIEELKEQQAAAAPGAVGPPALIKEAFIDKFTEDGIEEIRQLPMETEEDLKQFPVWVVDNFYKRNKFLKPGAGKGMTQEQWLDYVYKINRNIPVLHKRIDFLYIQARTGVAGYNTNLADQRQQRLEQQQKEKQARKQQQQQKRYS